MLYQTKNPHGGDIYDGQIDLDFSANTNPYGTPEGILRAVSEVLPQMHRYPDPYCRTLIRAIAEAEGVDPSWILCGNGAAELIYSYCRALSPRTGLELAPTFSEYSLGLQQAGGTMDRYTLQQKNGFELTEDFLSYLEKTMPEAVFLCTPNNPTGRMIPAEIMEKILTFTRDHGIRLFVDECFLDLSEGGTGLVPFLRENPQLLILKAFTKSYGMAGIRLGYCICADPETLGAMAGTVQPWNISSLAQAAGRAALKEKEFLEKTRSLLSRERPRLKTELEKMGFWVSNGCANYLMFSGPVGLDQALRQQRIAIRSCANYYGLGEGWYRIAVRLPEENQKLLDAIAHCVSKEELWQR